MKKFLQKTIFLSSLVVGLNIPLGHYLATYETVDLKQKQQFFPAARWDDYYAIEDNIDLLFLGSSHAYRSYDPKIIKEELEDITVFNFGSSGQTPRTGYYILEEVLRSHQPKVVVMDIFVMVFAEDKDAVTARINWSVMRPGEGKKKFFRESLSWSQKIKTIFFPTYLHRSHFKRKIQLLLGVPHTPKRKDIYRGDGFVSATDTISYEDLVMINKTRPPSKDLSFISENSLEYLTLIQERCAAKGVQLIMMVSPIPILTVERISVFDQSTELFADLAQNWGVPYYDFIDQRIDSIKDDQHYFDHHHMNAAGARVYSKEVAKVLKPYLQ